MGVVLVKVVGGVTLSLLVGMVILVIDNTV
jgi:hypothetical protein